MVHVCPSDGKSHHVDFLEIKLRLSDLAARASTA